jgi:hypothetical protein
MPSHNVGRGSPVRMPVRISAAIALALLFAFIFSLPTQAAPVEPPINPCNVPGFAVNIDPTGGAVQVRMGSGGVYENLPASIQRITFQNGSVVDAYCINSSKPRLSGIDVCLVADISDIRLAYLITKYPPDAGNNIVQAARQAAVWHYTNNIEIDRTDPTTKDPIVDAAVLLLYDADGSRRHRPRRPAPPLQTGGLAACGRPGGGDQPTARAGGASLQGQIDQGWLSGSRHHDPGGRVLWLAQPGVRDDRRQWRGLLHPHQHQPRLSRHYGHHHCNDSQGAGLWRARPPNLCTTLWRAFRPAGKLDCNR